MSEIFILKKSYRKWSFMGHKSKWVVSTVIWIYFGIPRLGHTIKTHCVTLQTDNLEICSILIFWKGVGLASPPALLLI